MKFSVIFAVSLLSAFAQAYSVDPVLDARAYGALDDHYRRAEIISDITTRELVEELEGRLHRRDHEYRDATKAKLHHKVDKLFGGTSGGTPGGTGGTGSGTTTTTGTGDNI